jgi:MinD superfamily P-loop ATPase
MKQILVTSGKGGTGKTVITASLACLEKQAVLCDCDVDAADLHLLLQPTIRERHPFTGNRIAKLSLDTCTRCGACVPVCRFGAISPEYRIDPLSCEGCALCSHVCTEGAIVMEEHTCGEWYVSDTPYGTMVHARLGIAEENSGKLVSVTRQVARKYAEEQGCAYVLIDGPPGIGCPVIASLSGVDLAIIVTEPTLSGIHDLERIYEVACHFSIPTACVVNKFDINYEYTMEIERWCGKRGIPVSGKIPFEEKVIEAVVHGIPPVEYADNPATIEIKKVWKWTEKYVTNGATT